MIFLVGIQEILGVAATHHLDCKVSLSNVSGSLWQITHQTSIHAQTFSLTLLQKTISFVVSLASTTKLLFTKTTKSRFMLKRQNQIFHYNYTKISTKTIKSDLKKETVKSDFIVKKPKISTNSKKFEFSRQK